MLDSYFDGRQQRTLDVHSPFTAISSNDRVTVENVDPPHVSLVGSAPGTSELSVVECGATVLEGYTVAVAPIDHITLSPLGMDKPPAGTGLAFPTGTGFDTRILLWSAETTPTGLVDSSMRVTAMGVEQAGRTLHVDSRNIMPGTYDVDVFAGGAHMSVPIVLTDRADMVSAINPQATIGPNQWAEVCFAATYQGRYVTGFSWTYVTDGVEDPNQFTNTCFRWFNTKTNGTVTVTASIGGASATVTLMVQ